MIFPFVLAAEITSDPLGELIKQGILGIVIVLIIVASAGGWIVWRGSHEKIVGILEAQVTILAGTLKEQTATMNRIADGIEERNRVETAMRGRRT